MEDPPHLRTKEYWTDYHRSQHTNFCKYKNPKRFIADQTFYALQYSNKGGLQLKNNLLIHWPGVNNPINNFLNNALATLSLHLHANGASIGTKPGILQHHETEFTPYQVNVPMIITKIAVVNDFLMDLLSVLSLPNTHPNWPQPSLTLSNLGYRNHPHTVRTLLYGNISWPKGLLLAAHVSLMAQATLAQQTGQFHYLRTSSRRSENDGSAVFSVTNSIRDSYMHVSPTRLTPLSQMMSFLSSRI